MLAVFLVGRSFRGHSPLRDVRKGVNSSYGLSTRRPVGRHGRSPGPGVSRLWPHVAILVRCRPASAELKDNLSRYIRRIEAGERIAATAHGRYVADAYVVKLKGRAMQPLDDESIRHRASLGLRLTAATRLKTGPYIRLPAGTAAASINSDRGEA